MNISDYSRPRAPRRAGFPSRSEDRIIARSAFTLVELLAVIAIVAVLAAIVITSVGSMRSAAGKARCLSNLRQIGTAASLYSQDNKNRTVPPYFYGALTDGNYLPKLTRGDMLAREGVWMCPEDDQDRTNITDKQVGIDTLSYGYNASRIGLAPTWWKTSPIRLSDIPNPARTLYFSDARIYYMRRYYNFYAEFRHGGKINVLFFDGHVATLSEPSPVSQFYDDLF